MHFTVEAQNLIRRHFESRNFKPLRALDATAGNGFDTLFLAELVSPNGFVLAMDIQPVAIEASQKRVEETGLASHVFWRCGCHSTLEDLTNHEQFAEFDVVMFNLGYLPMGDKSIITTQQTTMSAIEIAWRRLSPQGIMSVLSYPGHSGGSEEHRAVQLWMEQHRKESNLDCFRDETNMRSPVLWQLKKSLYQS